MPASSNPAEFVTRDSTARDIAESWTCVRRFAGRFSPADADDITQEAFTRALAHGVDLTADTWLRTVSRRVAIDSHRRRREHTSAADLSIVPDAAPTPEERSVRVDEYRMVREALKTLPPRYRNALNAYAVRGKSSDVAKVLGISDDTAYTLLSRARARLKLALERSGFASAFIWLRVRFSDAVPQIAAGAAAVAVLAGANGATTAPRLEESGVSAAVMRIVEEGPNTERVTQPTIEHSPAARHNAASIVDLPSPREVTYSKEVAVCTGDEKYGAGIDFEDGHDETLLERVVNEVRSRTDRDNGTC